MNFSYKQIWLIAYPILISLLMEHMINVTDTAFLGHVGEVELGASALVGGSVVYGYLYARFWIQHRCSNSDCA